MLLQRCAFEREGPPLRQQGPLRLTLTSGDDSIRVMAGLRGLGAIQPGAASMSIIGISNIICLMALSTEFSPLFGTSPRSSPRVARAANAAAAKAVRGCLTCDHRQGKLASGHPAGPSRSAWTRGCSTDRNCIRMRDARPIAFAGLRLYWDAPDDSPMDSWTIIATTPGEPICEICGS